jgi:hypothetical protein
MAETPDRRHFAGRQTCNPLMIQSQSAARRWHGPCHGFPVQPEEIMATAIDTFSARADSFAGSFAQMNRHSAPFNVSTREPAAIEYWCRHFNTTPERLLDAVKRVGSNPDIIRLELRVR